MIAADASPEAPYERLMDLVGRLAADSDAEINPDVERALEQMVIDAMADRSIDRELHLADVVRWLIGFVQAHRALRHGYPEIDADNEQALMRVIITRWLHPARRDA